MREGVPVGVYEEAMHKVSLFLFTQCARPTNEVLSMTSTARNGEDLKDGMRHSDACGCDLWFGNDYAWFQEQTRAPSLDRDTASSALTSKDALDALVAWKLYPFVSGRGPWEVDGGIPLPMEGEFDHPLSEAVLGLMTHEQSVASCGGLSTDEIKKELFGSGRHDPVLVETLEAFMRAHPKLGFRTSLCIVWLRLLRIRMQCVVLSADFARAMSALITNVSHDGNKAAARILCQSWLAYLWTRREHLNTSTLVRHALGLLCTCCAFDTHSTQEFGTRLVVLHTTTFSACARTGYGVWGLMPEGSSQRTDLARSTVQALASKEVPWDEDALLPVLAMAQQSPELLSTWVADRSDLFTSGVAALAAFGAGNTPEKNAFALEWLQRCRDAKMCEAPLYHALDIVCRAVTCPQTGCRLREEAFNMLLHAGENSAAPAVQRHALQLGKHADVGKALALVRLAHRWLLVRGFVGRCTRLEAACTKLERALVVGA